MKCRIVAVCCLALMAVLSDRGWSQSPVAQVVQLQSGSGATFLTSALPTTFPAPLGAADFLAAQTGPAAFVVTPTSWVASLASAPDAKWISNSESGASGGGSSTALYAIPFTINGPVASASLDLRFAVDNGLGDDFNPGLFLNGIPLPGTQSMDPGGWTFLSEHAIVVSDVAPMLAEGLNWLYVVVRELHPGSPTGVVFSATVSINTLGFELYGSGSPGALGYVPALVGSGSTVAGGQFEIELLNGFGGSPAFILLGLSQASLPMPSGSSLLVSPVVFVLPVTLSPGGPGDGAFSLAVTLPGSTPAGTSFVLQGFIAESGGLKVSSNGLAVTTY